MSILPIDAADRKAAPVFSGLIAYFPKTAVAVARLSLAGNIQHYGPGKPLHWNREVSADHQDCMIRHTMQSGTYDTDGILHDVKAAWRALAQAEVTIDRLEAEKCPCAEATCVEPWEPGCGLGLSPDYVLEGVARLGMVTATVPPFVVADSDDQPGLKAGEAYREHADGAA